MIGDDDTSSTGGAAFRSAGDAAGESLAPVIPLFGGKRARGGEPRRVAPEPSEGDDGAGWHTTWVSSADNRAAHPSGRGRAEGVRAGRFGEAVGGSTVNRFRGGASLGVDDEGTDAAVSQGPTMAEAREKAEAVLLRKLRSRSLSLAESRTALLAVEGVDRGTADDIVDHFVDLGYLDDAVLAEQVAMTAIERRGEGRRAIAQTLQKRGIPRDVAEAAVAALPDDDDDRALEVARSKVRSVVGVEYDAALRRLTGQLARRGYPGSVALTAAKAALAEAGIGRARRTVGPASGVRFTPDE